MSISSKATGYVTVAERVPDATAYPGAAVELLQPGSAVFLQPKERGPAHPYTWWHFALGADWRHPLGPESSLVGREMHPVVHVAYEDAEAYAQWTAKELPTEAEWESAARGGLEGQPYAWGAEFCPDGEHRANTWQGEFPWENACEDGYERTSPVGAFLPNGYGLVDMIGNVWEWTEDVYRPDHASGPAKICCKGHADMAARQPLRRC